MWRSVARHAGVCGLTLLLLLLPAWGSGGAPASWSVTSVDDAVVELAANWAVGLLNLNGLYQQPVLLNEVLTAYRRVEAAELGGQRTSPYRFFLLLSLDLVGDNVMREVEVYQDDLANWKLVLPAAAKNMKHASHERNTLMHDVWLAVDPGDARVGGALAQAKAELFNSVLGPDASFVRVLHAEVMPRRLAATAALVASESDAASRAAEDAAALGRREGAQARRDLNALRDTLTSAADATTKRARASQLDASARQHEAAAAAARAAHNASATLAHRTKETLEALQAEQEEDRSAAVAGTLDASRRTYVYMVLQFAAADGSRDVREVNVYKDADGLQHFLVHHTYTY